MTVTNAMDLERAHTPTEDPFWQESWYFNFADPRSGVYGLTRIGYRPSRRRADGLFLALRDGRDWILYGPVGLDLHGERVDIDPPDKLRTAALSYRCEEPLRRWHWRADTRRLKMDLVFTSFSPAYRYPAPMTDLERAAASDHYEQGGRVQGCIALGDDCVTVDGLGQRDHSWGPRHWAGIGRWIWAAGQFPSGWCFNIWIVGDGPAAKVVGFVGNGERVIDVVAGAVRWRGGRDGVRPDGADITLALKDGEQRQIEFTTCGYFPLYKDGSDIDESFGRYRCQGEDGAGVIEHLHRTRYRGLTWARLIPRYARLMVRSA